jgi:electron transport complex protein RnfG
MIRLTAVLALITGVAALALGFVYKGTKPMIDEQQRIAEENARRVALPEAICGVMVPAESKGVEYYEGYRFPDTTGLVGYTVKGSAKGYSSTIEAVVGVSPGGKITGMKIIAQQETPGLGTKIEEVKSFKTVADAFKEMTGTAGLHRITAAFETGESGEVCMPVGIKNPERCGDLERALAAGDTAGMLTVAPKALRLNASDSSRVFSDPALTAALSEAVLEELRREKTPWFQFQFIGKTYNDLELVRGETDKNIQGITGATISSRAVVEAVKDAMQKLDKALGGFEEKQR